MVQSQRPRECFRRENRNQQAGRELEEAKAMVMLELRRGIEERLERCYPWNVLAMG